MSGRSFRVIKWLGSGLTLLSFAFLGQRAWRMHENLRAIWPAGAWTVLLVASALYAGAGVALVGGWRALLARHGGGALPFAQAFRIYARTQIAKYIPGNIFQYAGRHLSGWKAGIPHHAQVLSAMGEAGGLALIAMSLVLTGVTLSRQMAPGGGLVAVTACLVGYPFAQRVLSLVGRRWAPPQSAPPPRGLQEDVAALAFHLLFFGGTASTFLLAAFPWTSGLPQDPGLLIAACALAWLAGFATPGAPAGLGIRELILVVSLEESLGKEGALGAAALFRGATTLGDLLLYAASLFIRDPGPPSAEP